MSRGGRGGFGARGGFGGRGGFSGGGRDIPFEIDPNLKPDFAPSELFPPNPPPVQTTLSKEERLYITRFREFRDKVSHGPFYTVMAKKRSLENPFEEVERFSRKYERKKRRLPKLDARPYVFEFFPPELHSTLDANHTTTTTTTADSSKSSTKPPTKRLHFSSLDSFTEDPTAFLNDDEDEEGKLREDGEGGAGADDDARSKDEDEDDEDQDEEDEDQFQDDMEGDYNAEQYFDSGEGEGWGDDGGGDDDGWF